MWVRNVVVVVTIIVASCILLLILLLNDCCMHALRLDSGDNPLGNDSNNNNQWKYNVVRTSLMYHCNATRQGTHDAGLWQRRQFRLPFLMGCVEGRLFWPASSLLSTLHLHAFSAQDLGSSELSLVEAICERRLKRILSSRASCCLKRTQCSHGWLVVWWIDLFREEL